MIPYQYIHVRLFGLSQKKIVDFQEKRYMQGQILIMEQQLFTVRMKLISTQYIL